MTASVVVLSDHFNIKSDTDCRCDIRIKLHCCLAYSQGMRWILTPFYGSSDIIAVR